MQGARVSPVQKRWDQEFGNRVRDQFIRRKSALAEAVGAQGGYLVPEEWFVGVDTRLNENAIFHRLAYRQRMLAPTSHLPSFDLTAAHANGSSPLFGGMTLTVTPEGQTIGNSEPSFSAGQLVARDLSALVTCSNQLLDDGGEPLANYLMEGFYRLIEYSVEYGCFNGSGVNAIAGIATAPATNVVTRQTTVTVTSQDLGNMVAGLLPACLPHACWAVSPTAYGKVVQLSTFFINNGRWLVGLPLYLTEKLPAVGTQGDLILFDPSLYCLGTRQVEIALSRYEPGAFVKNQSVFRITWRGDGQPLPRGTFTTADGSTTVGCFVALSTK